MTEGGHPQLLAGTQQTPFPNADLSGRSHNAACASGRAASRVKLTAMSLRGCSARCQYVAVATGLGSTTPAVYAACQMPARFTRRVISCARARAPRLSAPHRRACRRERSQRILKSGERRGERRAYKSSLAQPPAASCPTTVEGVPAGAAPAGVKAAPPAMHTQPAGQPGFDNMYKLYIL